MYVVSRKKQAARLTRAFRIAARFPRINTMCWFQLYDSPPSREARQVAELDERTADHRVPQAVVDGVRASATGPKAAAMSPRHRVLASSV